MLGCPASDFQAMVQGSRLFVLMFENNSVRDVVPLVGDVVTEDAVLAIEERGFDPPEHGSGPRVHESRARSLRTMSDYFTQFDSDRPWFLRPRSERVKVWSDRYVGFRRVLDSHESCVQTEPACSRRAGVAVECGQVGLSVVLPSRRLGYVCCVKSLEANVAQFEISADWHGDGQTRRKQASMAR